MPKRIGSQAASIKVKTVAFRLTASQIEDLTKISKLYGTTPHEAARLIVIQGMPPILRAALGEIRDHITDPSEIGYKSRSGPLKAKQAQAQLEEESHEPTSSID